MKELLTTVGSTSSTSQGNACNAFQSGYQFTPAEVVILEFHLLHTLTKLGIG